MIKNWLENGVFLYVMAGICAVGILLRMVLAQYYNHFLRNTAKWMETEKGWLSKVRREYEQCIEKQGKLQNVDIFVDKCVGTKKLLGIMLSTWNKIGGQAWILCLGVLAATVISGLFYQVDKELLLFHFLLGMWMVILNLIVDNLVDMTEKADQLRCNVKEYFDNHVEGKARTRTEERYVTDASAKAAVKESNQPKENDPLFADITQEEMEALNAIYDRADKPAVKEKRAPLSLAEKKAEKKKLEYRKSVMAKKKREEMKQQLMQEKDIPTPKQNEERKSDIAAVMAATGEKQQEMTEKEKQDWNETAAYLAKELGEDQANSHLIEAVLKEFLV